MKTENISIRVSTSLKQKLERKCEETGLTSSQIIRPLIEGTVIEPDIVSLGEGRFYDTVSDHRLINSLGFAELLFFLSDKRNDSIRNESDEFYSHLVNTIDKVLESKLITQKLSLELEKVQEELKLVINDFQIEQFSFPDIDGFDYEELYVNIHMMRFDTNNNQFILF